MVSGNLAGQGQGNKRYDKENIYRVKVKSKERIKKIWTEGKNKPDSFQYYVHQL